MATVAQPQTPQDARYRPTPAGTELALALRRIASLEAELHAVAAAVLRRYLTTDAVEDAALMELALRAVERIEGER
jgi:hypothetical protein